MSFDQVSSTDNFGLTWLRDEAQFFKVEVFLAFNDEHRVNARISILKFIETRAIVYWIAKGAKFFGSNSSLLVLP